MSEYTDPAHTQNSKSLGYYLHPAGVPSHWGVLDVGLKCVHSCLHCFYAYMDGSNDPFSGMRHAGFHTKDHVLTLVNSLADHGFVGFDITGGEPLLHPNIVDIVAKATEKDISSRIITLGQWLWRPMHGLKGRLMDELLSAGLTDFRLSIHEVDDINFKKSTGGSWQRQLENMNELDEKGFQYMTNTTITLENYHRLPLIAKELSKHNIYNSTILFMMAHYDWSTKGHAQDIQALYTVAAPYCREFVDILEDKGIACIVRYAPMCTIAGLERNLSGAIGVRFDPQEWMNQIDHKADPKLMTEAISYEMGKPINQPFGVPSDGLNLIPANAKVNNLDICGGRGSKAGLSKVFPPACRNCSAMAVCDGLEPQYYAAHGESELSPYVGDTRGNVLDWERVHYYPSYMVKTKANGNIKKAVDRFFHPVKVSDDPLVSIVVSCFNKGKYLKETLDSIERQTYENTEVIFVDDASTDNSLDIFRAHNLYKTSILAERKLNSGLPAISRNIGVELSQGELIVSLDADDTLNPTYVEECVQAFKNNPNASIVYTAVKCFDGNDAQWQAPPFDYTREIQQNYITCASMYRRSAWDEIDGYCEDPRLKGCEDWFLWINMTSHGHLAYALPRSLWNYRVHKDGIFQTEVVPNFKDKMKVIGELRPELYSWLKRNGWSQ